MEKAAPWATDEIAAACFAEPNFAADESLCYAQYSVLLGEQVRHHRPRKSPTAKRFGNNAGVCLLPIRADSGIWLASGAIHPWRLQISKCPLLDWLGTKGMVRRIQSDCRNPDPGRLVSLRMVIDLERAGFGVLHALCLA